MKSNVIPLKHRCSRCGALRADDELNSYDPITGDYRQAFCRNLADCKSESAKKIIDKVAQPSDKQKKSNTKSTLTAAGKPGIKK